jgi:hypothetical protein
MFPHNAHSHVQQDILVNGNRISDIGKALAPYAPNSITLKGWLVHMGEWNKGYLFHTSCNNGLHNLVFYETSFLHFQCVHVVACNGLLLIATPTNQSQPFKAFCVKKKPTFQCTVI